MTEYGFLLMASVSCPHCSYPTYPGGDPISFAVECSSLYSLIFNLTIAFLSPNKNSANVFASSVFPTHVGPRNMNDPMGFLGSLRPTLARLIALLMATIASF